jgi:ubiquitin C-terminal hydrolase
MKKIFIIAYFLFTLLSILNSQPPLIPNCGETCYLNAATQALFAISPLTQFLKENKDIYPKNSLESNYQLLIAGFQPLKEPNRAVLKKYAKLGGDMISKLAKLSGQEDASEFFGELVNQLRTNGTENAKSFISNLLGIFQRTTIECPLNEASFIASDKVATDYYLTLPVVTIEGEKLRTLERCLQEYTTEEILDDPLNYYFYEAEDKYLADCKKQIKLLHLSPILIIGLKRYAFDRTEGIVKKINHAIKIPLEIDMQPYLVEPQSNSYYNLIAIVMHQGTAKGGHYVAYVKYKNNWYLCNDEAVSKISASQVKEAINKGYVYIYEQTEPKKPYLEQKLNQLSKKIHELKNQLLTEAY